MKGFDRLAWVASWIAPVAWVGALAAFALWVTGAPLLGALGHPRRVAWALGLLAVLAVLSHLTVSAHGALAPHFSHDEKAELRWRLQTGRGYGHWRRLMRSRQPHLYKGRSHSGERPRFD